MKISRLLNTSNILVPITKETKEDALKEMIEVLVSSHSINNKEEIIHRVLDREKSVSTGIGYGIAVPHAKNSDIEKIKIVAGVSPNGISFEAIDDEPVYIIFLIASPKNAPDEHIQTLSAISKLTSYEQIRTDLKNAKNSDEFLQTLIDGEKKYLS